MNKHEHEYRWAEFNARRTDFIVVFEGDVFQRFGPDVARRKIDRVVRVW